jgi:hypothetical protein
VLLLTITQSIAQTGHRVSYDSHNKGNFWQT